MLTRYGSDKIAFLNKVTYQKIKKILISIFIGKRKTS